MRGLEEDFSKPIVLTPFQMQVIICVQQCCPRRVASWPRLALEMIPKMGLGAPRHTRFIKVLSFPHAKHTVFYRIEHATPTRYGLKCLMYQAFKHAYTKHTVFYRIEHTAPFRGALFGGCLERFARFAPLFEGCLERFAFGAKIFSGLFSGFGGTSRLECPLSKPILTLNGKRGFISEV